MAQAILVSLPALRSGLHNSRQGQQESVFFIKILGTKFQSQ